MSDIMPDAVLKTPLIECIWTYGATTPNAPALTAKSSIRGWQTLKYAELIAEISRYAFGLRSIGVKAEDRVGILADNKSALEFTVLSLAINRLGATFVPLNTRYSSRELHHILDRAHCRLVILDSKWRPVLDDAVRQLEWDVDVVHITDDWPHGATTLADLVVAESVAMNKASTPDWPAIDMQTYTEVFSTSGTTGLPKAAAFTWTQAAASAHVYKTMFGLASGDVMQCPFPVYVTAATLCGAMPILSAGGHLVIDDMLDVESIVARMTKYKATSYYSVPAFYIFLLDHLEKHEVELPNMKRFIYGGSAMPLATIQKIRQLYPDIDTIQTFGGTETGATGTILYPDMALSKLDSVGVPMPFTETKLVDDDGELVGAGERGEFAVRGAAIFNEYLKEPEKTALAIRDGWVLTGDICYMDDDGFYHLVDRKKDIIIRGGHNIGSGEVEDIIYEHPAVLQAAVVAAPHPQLGEEVFALVVCKKDLQANEEEIIDFCRGKMADYKVPRYVEVISQMPRNSMEKIQKTLLREQAKQIVQMRRP